MVRDTEHPMRAGSMSLIFISVFPAPGKVAHSILLNRYKA